MDHVRDIFITFAVAGGAIFAFSMLIAIAWAVAYIQD